MATYQVGFYRVLLSSDGHPFKCLQGKIDVPEVESSTQAAENASKKFAALHGVRDWRMHADTMEIVAAEFQ
jgi:hypothetical protein